MGWSFEELSWGAKLRENKKKENECSDEKIKEGKRELMAMKWTKNKQHRILSLITTPT